MVSAPYMEVKNALPLLINPICRRRAVAANANDRHRDENGANYRPFQASELQSRHTQQINSQTTSAEEFPWASMERGGDDNGNMAGLMPATMNEQGRTLNSFPQIRVKKH